MPRATVAIAEAKHSQAIANLHACRPRELLIILSRMRKRWRILAALAAASLLLAPAAPALARTPTPLPVAMARYEAARVTFENAKAAYLGRSKQTLTEFRSALALRSVAAVKMNEAKGGIRSKFRADVAAANRVYAAAKKAARTAAAKEAAETAHNAALAAAVVARDELLDELKPLSAMPPRPGR